MSASQLVAEAGGTDCEVRRKHVSTARRSSRVFSLEGGWMGVFKQAEM